MAIAIIALILWENPVKQPLGTVTEILELFVQLQGFDFFGIRPRSEGFGGNIFLKVFGKQINILDSVSEFSCSSFLQVLQNATNVNIKLAMNSREKLSELPLNRFYRYVLEPEVTFNEDGTITEGPAAVFSDMPQSVLLTMNMDTPLGWMVEAVYSPYDLDNIKLQEVRIDLLS